MSMIGPNAQSKDPGETVATYEDYDAAQKAVGKLIEAEIPAREISIVWAGLKLVETVTGRLGYGRAAWSGALNGAMLGLLFGAVFTLLTPDAPLQLLLGFMLVGTALGMVMRLLSYRMMRGRREYSSATKPVADHYEIAVAPTHAGKARGVLGQHQPRTQPVRPSGPLPPPQYGVRVDPATGLPIPNPVAPQTEQDGTTDEPDAAPREEQQPADGTAAPGPSQEPQAGSTEPAQTDPDNESR